MSARKNSPPANHSAPETIAAIITPPGEGGIAALRLAGAQSRPILERLFRTSAGEVARFRPFVMRYGKIVAADGRVLDEVMAVTMPAGRSYTGQDQAEIFCHGGRLVVRLILDELLRVGARAAEPGEFTRLAFEHGRIDLARAEAVAELIAANSQAALQASREHLLGAYSEHVAALREQLVTIMADLEAQIDFPEEEIPTRTTDQLLGQLDQIAQQITTLCDSYKEGRIINEGFRLAIAGRPNAGKSSLFNLLLRQERALVNRTPGTTRDYLSEWIEIGGVAVNIMDTAGLRQGGGAVEKLGQKRAKDVIMDCHLVIWVVDISRKGWAKQLDQDIKTLHNNNIVVVGNKRDLVSGWRKLVDRNAGELIPLSCLTKTGFKTLELTLVDRITGRLPDLTSGMVVTSARHHQKFRIALREIVGARKKISLAESPELIIFDLRQAAGALDEITGKVITEEILGRIFGKFCIGK